VELHFDAVFYYVSDLDRAIQFYSNVLGFKLVSRDMVARFEVDGVLFEVVPTDQGSKLQGDGNARLCLRVEDMQGALDQLRRHGIRTSEAHSKPGGALASFSDPDNNEICLWQYASARPS